MYLDALVIEIDEIALADLGGGAPGARPPFAWHPSSLADLGGAPGARPPFAWHPSF